MPRIGCAREALEVVEHAFGQRQSPDITHVGASGRAAWRAKSGVVYKIGNSRPEGGNYDNVKEFENVKRCQRIPLSGWAVPHSNLIEIEWRGRTIKVLAAEYIKHEGPKGDYSGAVVDHAEQQRPKQAWGIGDLHSGNVHRRGGIFYIIDAALSY